MEEKSNKVVGVLLAILSLGAFLVSRNIQMAEIRKDGVYERAYVLEREGAKGGVRLTYSFSHQGANYVVNNVTYRTDIAKGDSFYIKIMAGKPKGKVIFYKDKTEYIE